MKIAIIGSRNFTDKAFLNEKLNVYLKDYQDIIIISGGALGVDTLAKEYAKENNYTLVEHLPDYKTYGKAAPHVRNDLILDAADMVIAFWDGQSKGTMSVIMKAKKKKLHTITILV